jgi:hypothetical protein
MLQIGIDWRIKTCMDIVEWINDTINEKSYCSLQDLRIHFCNIVDFDYALSWGINGWTKPINIASVVTIDINNGGQYSLFGFPDPVLIKIKEENKMTTIYYNLTKLGGHKDILEYINKRIQKDGYCTVKRLSNHFGDQTLLVLPICDELTYGWTKQIDMNTEQQFNPADSTIPGYLFSISIPQAKELVLPPQKPVDEGMVNHPSHYNHEGRKECWEEMEELFGLYYTGIFDLMTAYKYFYRAGTKADNSKDQDIAKMNNYLKHCNMIILKGLSLLDVDVYSDQKQLQRQLSLLAERYLALTNKIEREEKTK